MKEQYKNLPLRSGVGIVVLNQEDKIFVAKRIDNPKNFWQMPQGGIDEGEDFLTAAYRELKEETSITKVELIKELDGFITYELPDHLLGIIWKGKYKGQKQKWFIMKFTGEDSEINIKTKKPEFLEWKWIELESLTKVVVDFKLHVYQEIKKKLELGNSIVVDNTNPDVNSRKIYIDLANQFNIKINSFYFRTEISLCKLLN